VIAENLRKSVSREEEGSCVLIALDQARSAWEARRVGWRPTMGKEEQLRCRSASLRSEVRRIHFESSTFGP